MAPDGELPEVARHASMAAPRCSPRPSPRRPTTNSRSRSSPPAKSCPACRSLDAVQNGTVEMGHTASYYYFGKDPTFAFGTAVPFGLERAQHEPWLVYHGGGKELLNEFYKKYNIYALLGRQHRLPDGRLVPQGDQHGRRPQGPQDAHRRLRRHDAWRSSACVPQQIAGGDIYPALEKGTIDAAEWVGPYDDEKLGFYKVAPYYYYPGWWEGGAMLHTFVNIDKWNALPKNYQAVARRRPAHYANTWMHGEIRRSSIRPALQAPGRRRQRSCTAFRRHIMEACYKAGQRALRREFARTNAAASRRSTTVDDWPSAARLSVVPGRRVQLRQFHDPQRRAAESGSNACNAPRSAAPGPFSLTALDRCGGSKSSGGSPASAESRS